MLAHIVTVIISTEAHTHCVDPARSLEAAFLHDRVGMVNRFAERSPRALQLRSPVHEAGDPQAQRAERVTAWRPARWRATCRNRSRARDKVDMTVPIGTPTTAAISL